jgi:DNA (cytosine-5)-methyltransferase 1
MQCGNAWGPITSTVYLAGCAAHREEFDNGFIEDEDKVLALYQILEDKGISIPGPPIIDLDSQTLQDNSSIYRYLHRIEKTVRPNFPLLL